MPPATWLSGKGDQDIDGEVEIYGRQVDAAGAVSEDTFRISEMGVEGDVSFAAFEPTLAYRADEDEYLVGWFGDHVEDGVYEVYGRRISGTGSVTGTMFQISDVVAAGNVGGEQARG